MECKMQFRQEKAFEFVNDKLSLDDKLEFLFHLDECSRCWDDVFNITRAQHPDYYKPTSGKSKVSDSEILKLERTTRASDEENVFEVA